MFVCAFRRISLKSLHLLRPWPCVGTKVNSGNIFTLTNECKFESASARSKSCLLFSMSRSPAFPVDSSHILGVTFCQTQQKHFYGKPARVGRRKILKFDYSGDIVTQPPLAQDEVLYNFKEIKEIEKVPETVRKLFTIEFADGQEKRKHREFEISEKIKEVCGPGMCKERKIAQLTVQIRNLISHCFMYRKDKYSKIQLIEKIAKRKKILKFLRREDYERFLWLLKELKIKYIPPPAYHGRVTRRAARKAAARAIADKIHKKKIQDLKDRLRIELDAFLEHKKTVLAEIDEDIARYNLDKETLLDTALNRKPPKQPDRFQIVRDAMNNHPRMLEKLENQRIEKLRVKKLIAEHRPKRVR